MYELTGAQKAMYARQAAEAAKKWGPTRPKFDSELAQFIGHTVRAEYSLPSPTGGYGNTEKIQVFGKLLSIEGRMATIEESGEDALATVDVGKIVAVIGYRAPAGGDA